MSRRYVIQVCHVSSWDHGLNTNPKWVTIAESAHTRWGIRRKWNRMTMPKYSKCYRFRIYDLHEGKVIV